MSYDYDHEMWDQFFLMGSFAVKGEGALNLFMRMTEGTPFSDASWMVTHAVRDTVTTALLFGHWTNVRRELT